MRTTTLLLLINVFHIFATDTYSQSATLTLNFQDVTIKEVLNSIEAQSEFYFLYNSRLIDVNRRTTVNVRDQKIERILTGLFAETDIAYVVFNKQVILSPREYIASLRAESKQPVQITGTVTDENGEPMIGVTVSVKGTSIGTITDLLGKFSLSNVTGVGVLTFSFVGYLSQEIEINNQSSFSITMKVDVQSLDEVVVVGYGTQRKVNLTGAVSQVKGEELAQKTATGSIEALQGLMPGTTITRTSGAPGEEGYEIQIRGVTSVNNKPVLVLLDGLPGNIENVRPEDIESISVLKDASAAAIYGSKAAGGVILVTTKRGEAGRLRVEYNSYYTLSKFARLPERLHSWENAEMLNEAWKNAGLNIVYNDARIEKFKDPNIIYEIDPANPNKWLYYGDFDYRELALRDLSSMQSHNVALSGGSENTTFRISGTFYENDGIIKIGYDSHQRYSGTATMENKIGKYLTLSNIMSYSNNIIEKPAGDERGGLEWRWGFMETVMMNMGLTPMKDPNGNWVAGRNVFQWSKEAGQRKVDENNLRINSTLAIRNLVKGLQLRIVAGMDANFNNTFRYNNPIYEYGVDGTKLSTLNNMNDVFKSNNNDRYKEFQFLTDYDINLNKHAFHLLGGYSINDYRADFYSAEAFDKININLQDFDWSSNVGIKLSDRVATYANQSVFGRFNYNYDERYLFEANVRYDGSSKLSPENRYQIFPSLSVGWRIDQENWFNIESVSQMKVRGSWGQLGNEGVLGNYNYIGLLNVNDNLILNNELRRSQYSYQGSLASESLSWETIETSNIGIDLGFFNNKLLITGDYFIKHNKDMLARVAYPSVIGVGVPLFNAGELKTWGWEANVSWRNMSRSFGYWINANLADAQNELVDYIGADIFQAGTNRLLEGYPINSIFGYKTDGLFQTAEEVAGHAFQHNRTGPGDVRYVDINKDGVITAGDQNSENMGDLVYLGNTNPRYTFGLQGGFKWKSFDFSLFFQGVGKRVASLDEPVFPLFFQARVYHAGHLDYWTENNPDAYWPRLYRAGNHNFLPSDRWVQNTAYIRLKDIQIGYSMSPGLLNRVGIQKTRIYLSGKDIWEYTNVLDFMDPEIPDGTVTQYPFSRRYSIGINLSF